MINVLFAASDDNWHTYRAPLESALRDAALTANLSRDHGPEVTDYIVYAPTSTGLSDFTPYRRTKAVLSLWAGVENIVINPTLTQPLARMVDVGMTEGMVEYVTGHVMRHHLGLDRFIHNPSHDWAPAAPPLARHRRVTVLGLGALGLACAQALAGLGFNVTGWSRAPKSCEGLTCLSGDEGLEEALRGADILVLLLPLTAATTNLMDARRLSLLAPGAVLINPARGPMVVDADLIAALDSGHLSHATLDVFRQEPLPGDHPFWAHPKVTVTPHIASETRADTATRVIAENIRRGEAGEPFLHLVDRSAGY